ncbi:DDE-type integrase/transposase/recombinase, partial [Bacillus thuringiensis]|uniref:DDE-type integrase/transposase/recombinase n=1 Tax=Bacillus thuringiensis TaxID=1428 RepID=UPI00211E7CDB
GKSPRLLLLKADPLPPKALIVNNQNDPSCLYVHTKHSTIKNLNNLIEQNHRHIKRRFSKSAGFQNLRHASCTVKGIETLHAIYKQKRSHIPNFSFSTYKELQQVFRTA